jgi:cellulose biosynthesis protein BcsQ
MNKIRDYSSIAFVSGKGGVGKTTLTTNIAWLISTAPARVLIIDLDFQNQGCTGLVAARYKLENSNALALLRADQELENPSLSFTQITENLQFLPAALIVQTEEHYDASLDVPEDLYERIDKLLNYFHELYSIDCFVLDCHGGIDATSIAAAGFCDHTLVVTEADTVTFAGTLALLDSYYDKYSSSDRKPKIEYIVNRIPPKYKWRDLDRLYQDYLGRYFGRFTKSKSILSYIPAEGYLADSFGEYPFQVKLAPSALFTRKLELTLYSLFHDSQPKLLTRKTRKRFRKKRYAKKIHRRIISNESRNIRTVFTSYGLASLCILLFIPYFYLQYAGSLPHINPSAYQINKFTKVTIEILGISVILYFMLGILRISSYFREKFKFKKAFFRILSKERTIWRRINLWKLRLLYYGSVVGATVFSLYMVLFLIVITGLIISHFFPGS